MDAAAITVFGAGYVGLVTGACLAKSGHDVLLLDVDREKLAGLNRGCCPFYEPGLQDIIVDGGASGRLRFAHPTEEATLGGFVFVAVGTPMSYGGAADLRAVRDVVALLAARAAPDSIVVMKSTVPPGTGAAFCDVLATRGVGYVSNPEFLREGSAVEDWYQADRIVLGGDDRAVERVGALYQDIAAPIVHVGIATAELVKYASNAFLATKISFINEIASVCDLVGADVTEVASAVGMDRRIGPAFLNAGIGYGGSCFPKDTQALDFLAAFNGYDFHLLKAVIEVNARQRMLPVKVLRDRIGPLAKSRIAVLGLAFKPETDDTRESPGLDIARLLLAEGAEVTAYDPIAVPILEDESFTLCGSIEQALAGAQGAVVATEWPEFVNADWGRLTALMSSPRVLFDGRNVIDPSSIIEANGVCVQVGRPIPR
jgi:UDPglucose 6-dehydrogenase